MLQTCSSRRVAEYLSVELVEPAGCWTQTLSKRVSRQQGAVLQAAINPWSAFRKAPYQHTKPPTCTLQSGQIEEVSTTPGHTMLHNASQAWQCNSQWLNQPKQQKAVLTHTQSTPMLPRPNTLVVLYCTLVTTRDAEQHPKDESLMQGMKKPTSNSRLGLQPQHTYRQAHAGCRQLWLWLCVTAT
jgi:hypothetical protein